ncbi:hypothetical protein N0V93_006944 [Gnomoniopsis smithogilvyi]|uniref:Uncharacterized protein n=1 Tax=Gnomoniopsis smithogilvyi TaxID=1191159 RepID=A0A9W8YSV5_9PEZI|nr:hypothetical protein N0V93_006944 [Gnomoniopsis smithogilvyi]
MFDVDWSDPNRESVGDRRVRKHKQHIKGKGKDVNDPNNGHYGQDENDDEDLDDKTDDQSGNRTSGSVRSSVSSSEKQFGFFGGKHRKKAGSSSRKAKTNSFASSSLHAPTIEEQTYNETTSASSQGRQQPSTSGPDQPSGLPPKRFSRFAESVFNDLDNSERAPGGSLFGCDITNPQPGFTTLFQELGDGVSMVTKTQEVSTRERTGEDSEFLISKIYVSAGDPQRPRPSSAGKSSSLQSSTSTQFNEVIRLPAALDTFLQTQTHSHLQGPQQPGLSEAQPLPTIQEASHGNIAEHDDSTSKQNRLARTKLHAPAIAPAALLQTTNAAAWKAPEDWVVSPTESAISCVGTEDINDTAATDQLASLALDLAHMEREADQMRNASPQVILQHLNDNCEEHSLAAIPEMDSEDDRDEASRASEVTLAYHDREMEKQRWLLSALHNMETVWATQAEVSRPAIQPVSQKILALFENHGTTSYLAVTNSNAAVFHLSPEPLHHKAYPNVHPMLCPIVSATTLAFAPRTFSSVSCVSIISVLPSSDIPKMLHNINRVLTPGGLLHMVLIDPCPIATSTGPLLREWLDQHLVFNLELQFRGIHPSRNFPVWLEEAKLRAKGSVITHTRFMAIPNGIDGDSDASTRTEDSAEHVVAVQKDLRATVGRLLWKEIWGPFITCDKWWWEVPQIVDECVEQETYWDYSIIAACKAIA